MPKITIWHNPKCSTSRNCLGLLEEITGDFEVRNYLEEPPTVKELEELLQKLKLEPVEIIRKKEALYETLQMEKKLTNKKLLLKTLAENPRLIQRPIVIKGNRAIIGRPPETIKEIL